MASKARKPRPYFILLGFDIEAARWGLEFGDYDRETVKAERADYRDHGWKAKHLKVVKTANARWATALEAIAAANATEGAR